MSGIAAFDFGKRSGKQRLENFNIQIGQALEVEAELAHPVLAQLDQSRSSSLNTTGQPLLRGSITAKCPLSGNSTRRVCGKAAQ